MSTGRHTPAAVKLYESGARSDWRVTLADGRVYMAHTYPESSLVYIENERGRKINGAALTAEVRAAIGRATGASHG
ncbi:MAG TPA: hypothetical protein VIP05_33710 [Burkholderiaceae bacterium]